MAVEYQHQAEKQRYVVLKDGERIGFAAYRFDGDTIVFTHTVIDEDKREKGAASGLVRFALDDVRETSGRTVVAECPYVSHWLGEHPEYQDLQTR